MSSLSGCTNDKFKGSKLQKGHCTCEYLFHNGESVMFFQRKAKLFLIIKKKTMQFN